MTPHRPAVALLGCLLAAAGCAEPEPLVLPDAAPIADAVRQARQDWLWIAGTRWELSAIQGDDPLQGTAVWVSFKPDETWMAGSAGCNRLTGQYERRGVDGLKVGPLAVTRMFCNEPAGVMQQEARVLHLLDQTDSYRASREWLHLLADDEILLSFRAAGPADP